MVLNKAHVEPEAKPTQRKPAPERQNLYIGKKIEKGAVKHVYCFKDVKTGWQNLYIEKKIEKEGGGTCILFKKW